MDPSWHCRPQPRWCPPLSRPSLPVCCFSFLLCWRSWWGRLPSDHQPDSELQSLVWSRGASRTSPLSWSGPPTGPAIMGSQSEDWGELISSSKYTLFSISCSSSISFNLLAIFSQLSLMYLPWQTIHINGPQSPPDKVAWWKLRKLCYLF